MPEKCDAIESNILDISQLADLKHIFPELHRRVHSLKGSGGTYGFPIISAICHSFEDYIISKSKSNIVINDFSDVCLSYLDLLRKTADVSYTEDLIKEEFELLRKHLMNDAVPGLFVESSSVMRLFFHEAVEGMPIKATYIEDAIEALLVSLHVRFSFIVLSHTLKSLNGIALLSAIKFSNGVNKNIKSIFLTAQKNPEFPGCVEPTYVIRKDNRLPDKLRTAIMEIVESISK